MLEEIAPQLKTRVNFK